MCVFSASTIDFYYMHCALETGHFAIETLRLNRHIKIQQSYYRKSNEYVQCSSSFDRYGHIIFYLRTNSVSDILETWYQSMAINSIRAISLYFDIAETNRVMSIQFTVYKNTSLQNTVKCCFSIDNSMAISRYFVASHIWFVQIYKLLINNWPVIGMNVSM